MEIRFATPSDSRALLRIYDQYMHTPVTFEYVLPSEEVFAARIEHIARDYPYLIAEEAGVVCGYAYAHRHMERAAYQWNAELSVYLEKQATGRGLGKRLYTTLMRLLRLQEVRTVYGCVTVPNAASEALHLSMGFRRIGTYQNAGYKNGIWHNVAWFEKAIAPHTLNPTPFLPLHQLDPQNKASALAD